MHNRLVAGVDCSTQSTKVMVVDVDKGEMSIAETIEAKNIGLKAA